MTPSIWTQEERRPRRSVACEGPLEGCDVMEGCSSDRDASKTISPSMKAVFLYKSLAEGLAERLLALEGDMNLQLSKGYERRCDFGDLREEMNIMRDQLLTAKQDLMTLRSSITKSSCRETQTGTDEKEKEVKALTSAADEAKESARRAIDALNALQMTHMHLIEDRGELISRLLEAQAQSLLLSERQKYLESVISSLESELDHAHERAASSPNLCRKLRKLQPYQTDN